jgi:hypothetical protein
MYLIQYRVRHIWLYGGTVGAAAGGKPTRSVFAPKPQSGRWAAARLGGGKPSEFIPFEGRRNCAAAARYLKVYAAYLARVASLVHLLHGFSTRCKGAVDL